MGLRRRPGVDLSSARVTQSGAVFQKNFIREIRRTKYEELRTGCVCMTALGHTQTFVDVSLRVVRINPAFCTAVGAYDLVIREDLMLILIRRSDGVSSIVKEFI